MQSDETDSDDELSVLKRVAMGFVLTAFGPFILLLGIDGLGHHRYARTATVWGLGTTMLALGWIGLLATTPYLRLAVAAAQEHHEATIIPLLHSLEAFLSTPVPWGVVFVVGFAIVAVGWYRILQWDVIHLSE